MTTEFHTLLTLLKLDETTFTTPGTLHTLTVDKKAKAWFFNIGFKHVPDASQFQVFHEKLIALPASLDHVDTVQFTYQYESLEGLDRAALFTYLLTLLVKEKPRFESLQRFKIDTSQHDLIITLPADADFAVTWEGELQQFLEPFGLPFSFVFKKKKEESIAKRIEKIDQEDEKKRAKEHKVQSFLSFEDRTVESIKHRIAKIPITEEALSEHTSAHRNQTFKFSGEIYNIDTRKLKDDMTLITWVVGDEEDAIYVKKFVRDPLDLAFMNKAGIGHLVKVEGKAHFDNYAGEVVITAQVVEISKYPVQKAQREDTAERKRSELHLHTKMSALDGIDAIEDYVDTAIRFNHKAIAITDHDTVQGFPAFFHATQDKDIKPIYGAELSVYFDSALTIYRGESNVPLMDQIFVVFDIETTGLAISEDEIIEISAIKIHSQQTIERFDSFIKIDRLLSPFTTELTSITDEMLSGAPDAKTVLSAFKTFIGDAVLVAHNASFDVDFIQAHMIKAGLEPVEYDYVDTLQLARQVYGNRLKRFNLKAVSKFFNVELNHHHRAEADTFATSEVFKSMIADLHGKNIKTLSELSRASTLYPGGLKSQHARKSHVTVWVQNAAGLKQLYTLISLSHTDHFSAGPVLPFSLLDKHRAGLIVGSGCMHSDFIEVALNKTPSLLQSIMTRYDVIELQPPRDYLHLFDREMASGVEASVILEKIHRMMQRVIQAAHALNIPVMATGDVHHIEEDSFKYRDIYIKTPIVGGGYHALARNQMPPKQFFKTTDEMLSDFAFLGDELAQKIVVDAVDTWVDSLADVIPFKKELYAPKDTFLAREGIPSAVAALKQIVEEETLKRYGKTPHPYVSDRIHKELKSIIDNQFSAVYYISHLLVQKSLSEGYLVGSRGSVGSSLVATLMQITEVNPLAPHYVCESCHFFSFKRSFEDVETYPVETIELPLQKELERVASGFDLRPLQCPHCQTELTRDGHDIPFETFLGFKGDKVPDIDLNFSGDYQSEVHEYIRQIFGHDRAFRAGTISTVAAKTAFGYVKGYIEKENIPLRKAEIDRRAQKISGVKRSTGQHPGGIVVVPFDKEITDVTPVQFPADDVTSTWKTTHFDYHSFEANLFKLDVLGHDDPTMIKYLMDQVQASPLDFPFADARDIPLDDPKVYQLLSGTDVIGVTPEALGSNVASYGVPEMGTGFVRGMLNVSKPQTFADIVKISGLSHGTDVWLNNAEKLVSGTHDTFAQVPFKDVIGCRDDIMVNLINYGVKKEVAFELSEFIRKGKASQEKEQWEGYQTIMRNHHVPEWYIWSCGQIKYMFPKAHATAYVMMALRIAWFKVYKPIFFYAAYFSKRAKDFDLISFLGGLPVIKEKMQAIEAKGMRATDTEKRVLTVLEVAHEMTLRGFHFEPIDIAVSDARNFVISADSKGLVLPFVALDGLGVKVAESIVDARHEAPFISQDDLKKRTLITKTSFDKLLALDVFNALPEDTQISLFEM